MTPLPTRYECNGWTYLIGPGGVPEQPVHSDPLVQEDVTDARIERADIYDVRAFLVLFMENGEPQRDRLAPDPLPCWACLGAGGDKWATCRECAGRGDVDLSDDDPAHVAQHVDRLDRELRELEDMHRRLPAWAT